MKVSQIQQEGSRRLRAASIETSGLDARILLAAAMGLDSGELIAKGSDEVSKQTQDRFFDLIEQRLGGKSVHRILGCREFFGREFQIGPHVLEPRPETELLVERVLLDFHSGSNFRFVEVGVGSGAIILTLLCESIPSRGIGTDISVSALGDAKKNAISLGVDDRVDFIEADCFDGIDGEFDFIVSNPPYIVSDEISGLSVEVRQHDPIAALDGGQDGLYFYRRLFKEAKSYLKPGGRLYLETGHGQHNDIQGIAIKNGWGIVSTHLDLSGRERIVVAEKH